MKKKTLVLSLLTAGLFTMPTLASRAQGCCGGGMPGCPMASHETANTAQASTVADPAPQPFKGVFGNYFQMEAALANDSLAGLADDGQAIVKAVNDDTADSFPPTIAQQADAVAKAQDLSSARAAFKPLSDSLIKFLADHNEKGAYVEVYCSMADAHWLQADKNVKNPYLGKQMLECGQIQN